ncbi:MAG: PTS transporter subunit EIIC [Lachnospiraceae bacterium]|nr:PTS transporter subunit EIIC [Lachnospiraceae bacterium]
MKNSGFGILQRVGRSFMLPIAILPVAGLLLGIGGSFSNTTMLETYGLMRFMGPGTIPNVIFTVMSKAGDIVFANLPILFAMGVAIGMAKKEKEVAALAAAIAFFIMHAAISAMISINGGIETLPEGAGADVVGIVSLQMGVFGGMLVGLGVSYLHNRFYRIELPQVLSFFGGTRFVPIICALTYVIVGILMYFIWPPVQTAISHVGSVVLRSGYFGTWFYGLMERALIPFGLHHVFYIPFWQTAVGGTAEIGGRIVEGAQNIFFAELAEPNVTRFAVSATRFMSGKFPLMIFGLPGAALAMYQTALPEKKRTVSGLLLSAALTSMLTGITEPLEFTFLFAAPLLYAVHCVLAGAAYMLMHIFQVGVGMTFSGGLIDLFLFGVLQGNQKTGWLWIPVVGVVYFLLYYGLFSFLIRQFDFMTPGRDRNQEVKLYTRRDLEEKRAGEEQAGVSQKDEQSRLILQGLGGRENLSDLDCCATRLRCTVVDPAKVDEGALKAAGASGVIQKGPGVQIIYGPRVTVIKSALDAYMEHESGSLESGAATGKTSLAENGADNESHTKKKRKTIVIGSPMTGTAAALSEAPDEGFAQGLMGQGAVITPEDAIVRAPADGSISFVFPAKHAIGFTTKEGLSMLIHVGIDTVKLGGNGFKVMVQEGDRVKKGDSLLRVNLDFVAKHAPSLVSPVLFTELSEGQRVRLLKEGPIQAGEAFLAVETEES